MISLKKNIVPNSSKKRQLWMMIKLPNIYQLVLCIFDVCNHILTLQLTDAIWANVLLKIRSCVMAICLDCLPYEHQRCCLCTHVTLCFCLLEQKEILCQLSKYFFILSFEVLTQLITAYDRPQNSSINNKVYHGNLEFKFS